MSVYTNWQASGIDWDRPPHEACSPNLRALGEILESEFGLPDLGCHNDRPVRAGVTQSTHSWGAAKDNGTTNGTIPRSSLDRAIEFLLWVADRAGLQQIHDYSGDRIWKNNRNPAQYPDGWKQQNGSGTGMGEAWASYLHVEVNLPMFAVIPDYQALVAEWKGGGRRADMLDISHYQTITSWADVPAVPIVHRVVTKENTIDDRFASRILVLAGRSELFGGYIVLAPGLIAAQIAKYVSLMTPHWRPGAFTQLDVERWDPIGEISIDELTEAVTLHREAFGPSRLIVYMNPTTSPKLWSEFVARYPTIPRWVPGYRPDDHDKAAQHNATVHQWTDNYRPSGFTGPVDANEIRNLPELRRIAGLDIPFEPPELGSATVPLETVMPEAGPSRILDQKPGFNIDHRIVPQEGTPPEAVGVRLNITVLEASGPGHLVVFPGKGAAPIASNVNFSGAKGEVVNGFAEVMLYTPTGKARAFTIRLVGGNNGTARVLLDQASYLVPAASGTPGPAGPKGATGAKGSKGDPGPSGYDEFKRDVCG